MLMLKEQISEFSLVGELVGFVLKDGYKVKYLKLKVSEREYWIKVSKEQRSQLNSSIVTGSYLEVVGTSRLCLKTGKLTLEADRITQNIGEEASKSIPKKSCTKILICEKSDCWKRGGRKVHEAITKALKEKGLDDSVEIKPTGCLKQCKKGPNLVVLPDKAKYSHVQPQEIPSLLERHFI